MKHISKLLAVLGLLGCFSLATPAVAQNKKETMQEKILRLEIENRVLSEKLLSLEQELVDIKAKQLANQNTQPTSAAQTKQHKNQQPAAQKASKPAPKKQPAYCASANIQKLVDQFPEAKAWARSMKSGNSSFLIVDAKKDHSTSFPFGWFTVSYELYVTYAINGVKAEKAFFRSAAEVSAEEHRAFEQKHKQHCQH